MDFTLLLIIAFVIGIYIGWSAHERVIIHTFKHNPEIIEEALRVAKNDDTLEQTLVEVETDSGETIKTSGVELAIESVNNTLYAYAKATNQFIAQGENIEELLKVAHKRFPGKTFFGELPDEEHQKS